MCERAKDAVDYGATSDVCPGAGAASLAAHSELLFFLQNKSSVMAFDHLVKLCVDFYTREEVFSARQLLEQYLSGVRMTRRQGDNAVRATIEDVLKHILNPNLKLPSFYATVMDRLPPVDATHCDVAAILKELQALRAEVRSAADYETRSAESPVSC